MSDGDDDGGGDGDEDDQAPSQAHHLIDGTCSCLMVCASHQRENVLPRACDDGGDGCKRLVYWRINF